MTKTKELSGFVIPEELSLFKPLQVRYNGKGANPRFTEKWYAVVRKEINEKKYNITEPTSEGVRIEVERVVKEIITPSGTRVEVDFYQCSVKDFGWFQTIFPDPNTPDDRFTDAREINHIGITFNEKESLRTPTEALERAALWIDQKTEENLKRK